MLTNRLELSLFLSLFFPPFFIKKIGTYYYRTYVHFSWKCPSSSARLHVLALPARYTGTMGTRLPIYQLCHNIWVQVVQSGTRITDSGQRFIEVYFNWVRMMTDTHLCKLFLLLVTRRCACCRTWYKTYIWQIQWRNYKYQEVTAIHTS